MDLHERENAALPTQPSALSLGSFVLRTTTLARARGVPSWEKSKKRCEKTAAQMCTVHATRY
jgi:hypothetical protein